MAGFHHLLSDAWKSSKLFRGVLRRFHGQVSTKYLSTSTLPFPPITERPKISPCYRKGKFQFFVIKRLGVAVLDGKLYTCGGYDGSTFLRSVEVFDPRVNKWSLIAPMSVTRSRVALAANAGKLWAVGGYDGTANLSMVEVYDARTGNWTFGNSMSAHEGGVSLGVVPLS